MQYPHHIAESLVSLAKHLRTYRFSRFGDDGKIMDANGNTVGRWEYVAAEG